MKLKKWMDDYQLRAIEAIDKIPLQKVQETIEIIKDCKGTVWICGNGGSANLSSHIATDLQLQGIKAISLVEPGMISCLGNDKRFEDIFSEQLYLLMGSEDVLIVFSGSGNSRNICNAAMAGKQIAKKTIVITGFDGGWFKYTQYRDYFLHINCPSKDIATAQDAFQVVVHLICSGIGELKKGMVT